MYEDAWYSYVPSSKEGTESSRQIKHRRKESSLKQINGGSQLPDNSELIMEMFDQASESNDPPSATLARRAKSYSDFFAVAKGYLRNEAVPEKVTRSSEVLELRKNPVCDRYEVLEDDVIEESHKEYRLYRDQLLLSERHLDSLLDDTSNALNLLASLSESFKRVESETTAFQAQCEDLLNEQKRVRDLADEVGTELQYYAYLEPLTRRLNAPGASRLVKGDDFLDILRNLNACITFMDQHLLYRDSSVYKTRYASLLERALNLVQSVFSSAVTNVASEVAKELRTKNHTETSEFVQLYGKFETIPANLGSQVERFLKSAEFAFGRKGDDTMSESYAIRYHELFTQILASYLKTREIVGGIVSKNLKQFTTTENPDADFLPFARHCIQYILDICHNEQNLVAEFFQDGPLLMEYGDLAGWNKNSGYADRLENSILCHLDTLHSALMPYLRNADLGRICHLVDWLENTYMVSIEGDEGVEAEQDDRGWIGQALLARHLWKTLNDQFSKAATDIQQFKPAPEDLTVKGKARVMQVEKDETGVDVNIEGQTTPSTSNAYPTVQTAVRLLVMYNDGFPDRPRTGDVLYEIVHQTTESLQKAATVIKKSTGLMDAQLFLIKNLMLIENLFMIHEIPDSVRQSAEFDFTPIWETIGDLQAQKQLFNPLAYITPLVKGKLLPAVVDRLLDARKELERVLVQQITAFTKTWQSRLDIKDLKKRNTTIEELEVLLSNAFDDETTRAALWRMIRAED